MAVIHNDCETINDKIKQNDKRIVESYIMTLIVAGILVLIAVIADRFNKTFLPFFCILGALYAIYCFGKRVKAHSEQKAIDISGAEGENLALTYLQLLDNRYHIITNAVLTHGDKRSEMDTIIVGPTGIYICEVKNYKGFIYGNTSDQNLIQVKQDNYGNTFENPFYNPCKQVATHRYTLNGVLNDFGIDDIYINTCVFFTNPEASINIVNDNDCDCKIVTDGGDLVNHIWSGEEILQSWDVAAIVDDIKASYENQTKLTQ